MYRYYIISTFLKKSCIIFQNFQNLPENVINLTVCFKTCVLKTTAHH